MRKREDLEAAIRYSVIFAALVAMVLVLVWWTPDDRWRVVLRDFF